MKAEKPRKKWSLSSLVLKWHKISPVKIEEELMLHFAKDELFDHHVILPHSEVNPLVYETVDRFTERYGGERLSVTIYSGSLSDSLSDSSEQFFREAFVSHYEDEYRRATLELYHWYFRVLMLALIGIVTYYIGIRLEAQFGNLPFLITAIVNVSLFCIWEICNTNLQRRDTLKKRKRIKRAMDAEIRFR